jgi:trigger factor
VAQLKDAFEEKEMEWIISDLGIKDDPAATEKYFKILITKVGLLEKKELNEEFFEQLFTGQDVKTEEDFRDKIKSQIQAYWNAQATNQIHDQIFHQLVDGTEIKFPEGFLRKWVKTQGEGPEGTPAVKSDEQVEKEFPVFISQLKWTLITDKIVTENAIQVMPDEIRDFARQQLFSYMGGANMSEDQPWVKDYIEKMMKDRKYVEDAHTRIQTQKIFRWAETQVKPADQDISAEEFTKMVEAHQHHHH